jgi:hypothetical protein
VGKRASEESDLQRAVVEHLKYRAVKGAFWFHCPNGGFRTKAEAGLFKAMGVRAGVPDLLLLCCGKLFALELKSRKGRCSENQLACHYALAEAGASGIAVVDSIDDAIAWLTTWGILR